jgi:uncharacterized ubiquitin-like protein YukD
MSNTITVDIHTPLNEVLPDSQIPDDYSIQEVIDELVDELELPRFDAERAPIDYSLFSISGNSHLSSTAKVAASLRSGEVVRLEAKSNGKPADIPPSPGSALPPTIPVPEANANEISVILKVLDLHRAEQITLSTTRPISELIRQIVSNYNLPPRDNLGNLIIYRLRSKALGKFMPMDSTPSQEGVPMLDTLMLHREETAGARGGTIDACRVIAQTDVN